MSTFVRIVPAQIADIFFIHCEIRLSIISRYEVTYSNPNGHKYISDLLVILLIQALGKKRLNFWKRSQGKDLS